MTALIGRLARERLAELAGAFRIVIVNGPRQAGKTTLLRLFHQQHGGSYRSLDDADTRRIAKDDPTGFAGYDAVPRVIDEIQRGGDDLLLAIKYLVDQDNRRGQFVLAGSTQFLTVPNLSESLAGRAAFVELWPLCMAERVAAPGNFCELLFAGQNSFTGSEESGWSRREYLETICAGGYPEVLGIDAASPRRAWFDGYLSTVVLRDIGTFAHFDIQHGELIPHLLGMIAARAGSQVVLADLASSLQVNQATVRRYLAYLETVFLASRIRPWLSNQTARLVKTPKVFPTDTGLAAHLLQVDLDAVARPGNPTTGTLVETFVCAELTRLLANSDLGASLHFYRDRDGREVDFILERRNGQVVGIEVKASSTIAADDFRHLRWLRDQLGDRFVGGYLVYLGTDTHPFGDRMLALPLSAMWQHRS